MVTSNRFVCPVCGFPVFNRRVTQCESCKAALPADFAFSAQQLQEIEAEHEKNDRIRARLERGKQQRRSGEDGGIEFDAGEGGDGGGSD